MSRPASRQKHKKFCDVEGWEELTNARGRKVGHHITYEFALADGNVLRTRISRPANTDTYGPALWSAILRDQLCVTEAEFWACADKGVRPRRPGAPPAVPSRAIPAGLAHQLVHTVGMTERQVAVLSRDEAIALMNEHWSRQP